MPDHICPHVKDIGVLKRTVDRLDKEIFGNGHKGVAKEMTEMHLRVNNMEESFESIRTSMSAIAKSQVDSDATARVRAENKKNMSRSIEKVGIIFSVVFGVVAVIYLVLDHI